MHDDVNVRGRDVRVRVEEVLPQVAGVELWRVDGMFFGLDVDCVLDRVGGDYNAVVCFCVSKRQLAGRATFCGLGTEGGPSLRCLDLALEQAAHCHLRYGLDAGILISVDLADADIVLAITGRRKTRHGDGT